jgi:hypothetical protein
MRSLRLFALAALAGAATGSALVAAGPAAAVPDPFTTGYVLSGQVAPTACFPATAGYSYNSRTQVNSVCPTGSTGGYSVRFRGLASAGGNVQVTAYGATSGNCKVRNWYPDGADEIVNVNCFDPAGRPRGTMFSASFTAGGGSANTIAFAWADQPAASSYTPSPTYQYNNTGGASTISRAGTGDYTVSIPNGATLADRGTVKVTSYGTGSGVCKVNHWNADFGSSRMNVHVRCFASGGAPSDERFSIVYADGMNTLGDNLMADAYAWGDQPSSASYVPAGSYQSSRTISHFGTVTITRPATGTYDVRMPYQNEGLNFGNVQATAYGSGTERCQVGSWTTVAGARSARILCFTNTGAPADTMFTMQYTAKLQ